MLNDTLPMYEDISKQSVNEWVDQELGLTNQSYLRHIKGYRNAFDSQQKSIKLGEGYKFENRTDKDIDQIKIDIAAKKRIKVLEKKQKFNED